MTMDEQEKKVDESWKDKVEQEKQQEPAPQPAASELPQADFSFFVTSLSIQAAISLGQIPNPVTQKLDENLGHAKLIIDTLAMLKEKTTGNLSADEDSLIENYLYELRMQYVEKMKGKI